MENEKNLDKILPEILKQRELNIKIEDVEESLTPPIVFADINDSNFEDFKDIFVTTEKEPYNESSVEEVINQVKNEEKNDNIDVNDNIDGTMYVDKGKVYVNGQLDNILEKICSERLLDFFRLRDIDEIIIKNLAIRRIIFEDTNRIMTTSYDKKEHIYYDFEMNKFEPADSITDKSILIQGRNKSVLYLAVSLIEALSFLNIMYLKRQEYKEYTVMIVNENLKVLEYYNRKINDVKMIFMLGDYWSNEVKRKLENNKRKYHIENILPIENTLNEDLKYLKGSSV